MDILVIMLGAFILYITEGWFYSRFWSKGLDAKAKITPLSAFKGDKCTMELTVANRKLLPLPWLWIKLHISSYLHFDNMPESSNEYVYHNSLFCIMGWQEIKRSLSFTCTKRGYYPLRSFEVIGTSILFNGKHSKSFDLPPALTVYPSLIAIDEIDTLISRLDGTVAYRGFINPDPFEFSGIREYSPTDSLKDINFRASAHMNTLMSNTHNPTVKGEITIILCFRLLKESFEEERFEYAVSLAATLSDYYIRQGYSLALYSNGIDPLSDTCVKIEGGIGEGHLSLILESLGRISYTKTDTLKLLKPDINSTSSAIFISPTVDMDILELYGNITEKYFGVKWLFPVMSFYVPHSTPPVEGAEIVPVPPE